MDSILPRNGASRKPGAVQLKKLRIRRRLYTTRDEARADIFEFIELFYNAKRRHSHVGGVSPQQFEADYVQSVQGV